MKKIALIGSTGSIGRQVLNVVRLHPDKFKIISLSAGTNASLFTEQVKEFAPVVATLSDDKLIDKDLLSTDTQYYFGENAFTNAVLSEADVVVVALVGFKGIIAVLDAIKKKKNIALANKESLVIGGELVTALAKENGVTITPIDSEHSAVWQALNFDYNTPFNKIILTASGGAFRDYTLDELKRAKSKDALIHPNWAMGKKITIDCATLVNKGFEVIEAKWLYQTSFDKIDIIIHRESIIHSMVEFIDGVTIAQMSYPTMEIPILLALNYPDRIPSGHKGVDFKTLKSLTFSEYDSKRFPCFDLVVNTAKKGGAYTACLNGANETAVKLFLEDKISFTDIYKGLSEAVNKFDGKFDGTYESLKNANDFGEKFVLNLFGC